jgi:hypothetical protein
MRLDFYGNLIKLGPNEATGLSPELLIFFTTSSEIGGQRGQGV